MVNRIFLLICLFFFNSGLVLGLEPSGIYYQPVEMSRVPCKLVKGHATHAYQVFCANEKEYRLHLFLRPYPRQDWKKWELIYWARDLKENKDYGASLWLSLGSADNLNGLSLGLCVENRQAELVIEFDGVEAQRKK